MKSIFVTLLSTAILFAASEYRGGSTAPVVVAGGIVKAKHVEPIQKKYKRSQCPICKGKGWYLSGDKIKKVDCGYCEPDQEQTPPTSIHRK